MFRYAELQASSNFSFLRGASHPNELVVGAAALGLEAIGICDRNTLAGVVRAWSQMKLQRESGSQIRALTGCRLDFVDGTPSLLVYPTDREAYGRLTRLLTVGQRRAEKEAASFRARTTWRTAPASSRSSSRPIALTRRLRHS